MLSVDPSLGKVEKQLLSPQTLIELLIGTINTNKENICGDINNPRDISEWETLTFNDTDEVIKIDLSCEFLEGSIELQWLPPTAHYANFAGNMLSGTVDLTCLPERLEFFALSRNRFTGTVDLTQLPKRLVKLYLYSNYFHGKTDFSQLPKSLKELNVSDTQLEGKIVGFAGIVEVQGSFVTICTESD